MSGFVELARTWSCLSSRILAHDRTNKKSCIGLWLSGTSSLGFCVPAVPRRTNMEDYHNLEAWFGKLPYVCMSTFTRSLPKSSKARPCPKGQTMSNAPSKHVTVQVGVDCNVQLLNRSLKHTKGPGARNTSLCMSPHALCIMSPSGNLPRGILLQLKLLAHFLAAALDRH